MGVFTERLVAVLVMVPWKSRGTSDGVKARFRPDGPSEPMFMTSRECSPSMSVQRADFEALRAICRVR